MRRAASAFVGDQGGGLERESGNFTYLHLKQPPTVPQNPTMLGFKGILKANLPSAPMEGGLEGKDFPQMTKSGKSWRAGTLTVLPWFPVGALLDFSLLQGHLQQKQGRGAVLEHVEHSEHSQAPWHAGFLLLGTGRSWEPQDGSSQALLAAAAAPIPGWGSPPAPAGDD